MVTIDPSHVVAGPDWVFDPGRARDGPPDSAWVTLEALADGAAAASDRVWRTPAPTS